MGFYFHNPAVVYTVVDAWFVMKSVYKNCTDIFAISDVYLEL